MSLEMMVGIKWVPNTQNVRFDPKTGTLIREGVPSIVNPADLDAVELALKVKDTYGGRVRVITMAPPSAVKGIEHVIGMGVDEGVLVTDRVFAGADTLATSYVLSQTIKKLGLPDLLFFGQETIDSSTAHIPAQVASWLDLPYVYYVDRVEEVNREERYAVVRRKLEDRYEWVRVELPAVIAAALKSQVPRPVRLSEKLRFHRDKPLQTLTNKDLGLDPRCVGLRGSPTIVAKVTWMPEVPRKRQVFKGDAREAARWLVKKLAEEGILVREDGRWRVRVS